MEKLDTKNSEYDELQRELESAKQESYFHPFSEDFLNI